MATKDDPHPAAGKQPNPPTERPRQRPSLGSPVIFVDQGGREYAGLIARVQDNDHADIAFFRPEADHDHNVPHSPKGPKPRHWHWPPMVALLVCLLVSGLLTGCGSSLGGLSRILFTGVSAADLDQKGIVEGACADLKSAPLGVAPEGVDVGAVIPVSLLGDPALRWLVFVGKELADECAGLELNSRIRFAGLPDEHGVIHVSTVSVDGR